jgi:hypothetical protein
MHCTACGNQQTRTAWDESLTANEELHLYKSQRPVLDGPQLERIIPLRVKHKRRCDLGRCCPLQTDADGKATWISSASRRDCNRCGC